MFFFGNKFRQTFCPLETQKQIQAGSLALVDVRGPQEVAATGIAQGALHIPLDALRERADPAHPQFIPALKGKQKLAVYCASGARSFSAARILRKLGYPEVQNIGGLRDWERAGGKITHIQS